ncbi:MAG TPA: hypothetical protein VLN47_01685 [Clostridiaceae bacterium]|nr:hypothetical protein [Clostridiaceae bacterium]
MNMKKSMKLLTMLLLLFVVTGCSTLNAVKLRYGLVNEDFEFLKSEDLVSLIIQNKRDRGFRFIVRDKGTILDLYGNLSRAKAAETPSAYEPDYVFEFHMIDGTVREYQYVAGISKQEVGNFYNADTNYRVTGRIDNDIIKNLYSLRRPKYFDLVYYESLTELLNGLRAEYQGQGIGIRIHNDVDVLRYQLSREVEAFRESLNGIGAVLLEDGQKTDIVLEVKTQGYKTNVFKAIVSLKNNSDFSTRKFYIYGLYGNNISKWDITITEEKPEGF